MSDTSREHAVRMAREGERFLFRPTGADTARARACAEIGKLWAQLAALDERSPLCPDCSHHASLDGSS